MAGEAKLFAVYPINCRGQYNTAGTAQEANAEIMVFQDGGRRVICPMLSERTGDVCQIVGARGRRCFRLTPSSNRVQQPLTDLITALQRDEISPD